MYRVELLSVVLLLSSFAQGEDRLSLEDRVFELSAQVTALENELEAVNNLATQERANAFNPSISVVGDLLGQVGIGTQGDGHHHDHDHSHRSKFRNGMMIREIEFELRGDIDPFADAMVAFAIEPNFDHAAVHLEEAYARLKVWPGLGFAPLGLVTKAGRFRTAIGRINRVHLHNIPQISYPLAMQSFLGDEGHSATGLSFQVGFNPSAASALNIFAEAVFNSRLPMQEKGAEKVPTGIAHGWWHQEFSSYHFLDIGTSALLGRRGKAKSGPFLLFSADVHYSYLPPGFGQNPLFLFGSEFFIANAHVDNLSWPFGGFAWAQVSLFGSTFLGLKYDLAPTEDYENRGLQHAIGAYLSYYTTEFLRFRLGYEHVMPKMSSLDGDHRFMLSMNFVLGSHPIEPYFVNR